MDNELGGIETEMKRGFLQLLVLVLLEKEAYGYAMVRAFRDLGYEVEENTLYPLLRRLEKLPRAVKVMAREGKKAALALYPAQMRSRAALSALAIINGDGYMHNLFVVFPDGEIRRESSSSRFATALEGVDLDNPGTALDRSGHPNPVPRIVGRIRRMRPVEVDDLKFLKAQYQ